MKQLEVFLLPLDGMLVHHRSLPCNFVRFPQQFASTHLYTWVKRGTVRVKCLAQEHNTTSLARAQTQTTWCTNHEATIIHVLIPCHRKHGQSQCRKTVVYSSVFQQTFTSISAIQLYHMVNCVSCGILWAIPLVTCIFLVHVYTLA